eukprot:m.67177 g.67177  ORF g.67177 m.67177 type:complete len:304 (-) comp19783_c0_seq1:125-1036(-)
MFCLTRQLTALSRHTAPSRCLSSLAAWANPDPEEVNRAIHDLTEGCGFYVVRGAFTPEETTVFRERIHHLAMNEGEKATHFTSTKMDAQKRVWNVLNKGDMFVDCVQHPFAVACLSKILGHDFALGSIAANVLLPGATGQEGHLDFPYWTFFDKARWPACPKVKGQPFFMNVQCNLMLTKFTKQNGATAVVPHTQIEATWPNQQEFKENSIQVEGEAGDLVIHTGLLHHAAMPNNSDDIRSALLMQFLPSFVKPMEDLKRCVRPELQQTTNPLLRQLLALDYRYPEILDEAPPENTEGEAAHA